MNKTQVLAVISKMTVSLRGIFPTKTQVQGDLNALEANLRNDIMYETGSATRNKADTSYVDNHINEVKATIASFQAGLDDKINTKVASLGTFLGESDKYSTLPKKDQNKKDVTIGDFVHLTKNDGNHKRGLYRYDGTNYVFVSGDPTVVEILDSLKATSLDDTVDNKFVTPKWVKDYNDANSPSQDEIDQAVEDA